MKEKYLPIGSVVLLKGASKRLMITGYCAAVPEDINKTYDYVACLYPEGNLGGEDVALFDHDKIGTVVHLGLVDNEFTTFDARIKKLLNEGTVNTVQEQTPQQKLNSLFSGRIEDFPPMTPDNIQKILSLVKQQENLNMVQEPTAFSEEALKKPKFSKSSLTEKGKREEKKKEEDRLSAKFSVEDHTAVEKKVESDGTPVLQLQLIGDGVNNQVLNQTPTIKPVLEMNPSATVEQAAIPKLTPLSNSPSSANNGTSAAISNLERL